MPHIASKPAPRSYQAIWPLGPGAACVADFLRHILRPMRFFPRGPKAAVSLTAGIMVMLALQVYLSAQEVTFLPEPLDVPGGGQLLGFELDQTEIRPKGTVSVTLFGRDLPPEASLSVVVASTGFNAVAERRVDLSRTSFSTAGLQSVRKQIDVPAFWKPGAYSLRVPGTPQTFGHFEIKA